MVAVNIAESAKSFQRHKPRTRGKVGVKCANLRRFSVIVACSSLISYFLEKQAMRRKSGPS